jgi:hypothetical protein
MGIPTTLRIAFLGGVLAGCQVDDPTATATGPSAADTTVAPVTRVVQTDTNYYPGFIPSNRDSAVVRLYLDSIAGHVHMSGSVCTYSVVISLCCRPTTEIHDCAVHFRRFETFKADVLDSTTPESGSLFLVGSWSRWNNMSSVWDTVASDGKTPFQFTDGTWITQEGSTALQVDPYLTEF